MKPEETQRDNNEVQMIRSRKWSLRLQDLFREIVTKN